MVLSKFKILTSYIFKGRHSSHQILKPKTIFLVCWQKVIFPRKWRGWNSEWSNYNCTCFHLSFRLEYYSKPEADFGRDWCVALDYLAAASFPTTFIQVSGFQKGLPPRVLVDGDKAPFISDFTDFQNTVLLVLNLLHQVDNATGKGLINNTLKKINIVLNR